MHQNDVILIMRPENRMFSPEPAAGSQNPYCFAAAPLPDFGRDGALPLPPPDLFPVVDGQLPPLSGLLDDGPFEVFLDT